MGIYHFSGLFVLLCIGLSGSLLTSLGEHVFYRLVLPRIKRKKKFNYWLHTSQVGPPKDPPPAPVLLPPSLAQPLSSSSSSSRPGPPMPPNPRPPPHLTPSVCLQKIHRALNTGTEEQQSQRLGLEQRYGPAGRLPCSPPPP